MEGYLEEFPWLDVKHISFDTLQEAQDHEDELKAYYKGLNELTTKVIAELKATELIKQQFNK